MNGDYNEKCDLWSCGVICYILLSGNPPFEGDTDQEIIAKVQAGKYDIASEDWKFVSSDAKSFIKKLMTKNIKKRYSAA